MTDRAVAGAATEAETADEPTPTRWLDQPGHAAGRALDDWLPGLTRHQQADKWLRAEAHHDRGPRGQLAARIVERWAELAGATAWLRDVESLRGLLALEAAGPARPAVVAGLNYRLQEVEQRDPTPQMDAEPETAVADGGERGVCDDCGADKNPDQIGDDLLWWCQNCQQLTPREVTVA